MSGSVEHAHICWIAVCDAVQPACRQQQVIVSTVYLIYIVKADFHRLARTGAHYYRKHGRSLRTLHRHPHFNIWYKEAGACHATLG